MHKQYITMTSCSLIADTRERLVLRHETEFSTIALTVKQITVGDYIVVTPEANILAVIERKSLEDFAASLKDGRHDNKRKLLDLRAQTGCRIIFIIEGPEFPQPGDCFGNIPYKNIESSIFHLAVRDGVVVLRTKDTLCTAKTLARFVKSMDTLVCKIGDAALPQSPPVTAGPIDISAVLAQPHHKSTHEIAREMWSCFRGISVENADDYICSWSIADIIQNAALHVPDYKLPSGRKINKRVARSLQNIDSQTEVKILSAIPMISQCTAKEIISRVPLRTLISSNADHIAKIQTGKTQRALGISRADKILQQLHYKFELKPQVRPDGNAILPM